MSVIAGAPKPKLSSFDKAAYGLGSTAEAIVYTTTASFLLIFYNQVRGIEASYVGIALAVGMIVNAVFDPLVGSWSDRVRTRLGRRHPFLFGSILPGAICFYFLFNPPEALTGTWQLVWLTSFNVLLLQCMSLYHTPHMALGGELSDDYLGRSRIMAYNTFFLWVGDTLGWVLSFAWFFRTTEEFSNGALDPSRYDEFGISFAALIILFCTISALSTAKFIPSLPQAAPDTPKFGPVEFFRDFIRACSNRNYIVLLIGMFFLSLMTGVRAGLWFYSASFFWQINNTQISFFAIGSFAGYLFGVFAVTRLHDRFDKRWTGMFAVILYSIGPALPLALGYLGILTAETPGLLYILIAFSVLQHAPYSVMTTTVYSALADIADENEVKYGLRQEGILYAARTLFARVDQAIGTALAGWVLTIIAFPDNARVGEVAEPVLMALAGAFVLSTIPGLVAAIFYGMLRVTKETYDTTRETLEARRVAEAEEEAVLAGPA
ncbi:MFS transporter [Erythrobacter sp.]|uniref:MFS transporter n=1 Tax=Erythrobacter sp. TaxID=1042 RepID=UPI002EC87546|nr:MFS transporter [Erythrobacter sp.]